MTVIDSILVYSTVFGVATVALLICSRMLRNAASQLGPRELKVANYCSIALGAWFFLAIVYALTVELSFPALFPMLAVPWSVGLWLMFTPSMSRILSAIPLHRLHSVIKTNDSRE